MDEGDVAAARSFYENTSEREQITICMATHPPKGGLWKNAYADLRRQCDRFILVLGGGYTEVPGGFLDENEKHDVESGKMKIAVAGKDGLPEDKGCQNKFMFYGDFPGYYCTFDDDIRYSQNCVYQLVLKYEQYRRKAIVSFHGKRYTVENGKIVSCYDKKKLRRFQFFGWHKDEFSHLIGTGCMAVRPADFSLSKAVFLGPAKNVGDDELLALWAQRNNVPLVAVDNTHCILSQQEYD